MSRTAYCRIAAALAAVLLWHGRALAGPEAIEVLVGTGEGTLDNPQPNINDSHLVVAFCYDLKPFLDRKLGWRPGGEWQYRIEPFVSIVNRPKSRTEAGAMFAIKASWKAGPVSVYAKGGTGTMYTSLDTLEQATRLNFVHYAAIGLSCRVSKDASVSVERWVRHYSNARIATPNSGIDTSDWLVGYTWDLR